MSIGVLLVDDDADEYPLIRDLLEQSGEQVYRLEYAHSADEARKLVRVQQFDAYLIDYLLGAENGLELARELVALTPDVPYLLLTGMSDRQIDSAAMEAGAADYLNKAELTSALLEHALHYALGRTRAVEQLRASEAFHRSLVEISPDLIAVHQGGKLVYINPVGTRLLADGDAALLLGRPVLDFVPAERRDEVATNSLADLGEEPARWNGQTRLCRTDGREIDVKVSSAPVRYQGKPARLALVHDVEAQVRAAEELRFQASVLDAVEQAVIATNLDGTIRYWNRFAERLYGWSAEEVLGRHVGVVTPHDTSMEQAATILAQLRTGRSWSGEFMVQRRDGAAFPAHVSDSPLYASDGRLVGYVGISYDLGEYKIAEAALRRSEARFRAMFDFSPDLLCIAGVDGYFKNVNPAFESTLGWTLEALLARPFVDFVHPDDQASTVAEVAKLGQGIITLDFENRYRTAGSEYRHLSWRAMPSPDDGLIYAVARDMTDARQAAAERHAIRLRLVESEKLRALGQLAAGVAHDVNNVLAAIIGPLELLRATFAKDNRTTPPELGELDQVIRAAEDAASTVRRLQAFARPKQEAEEHAWEMVQPDQLLDDVVAFTRPRWRDQAGAEGRRIAVERRPGGAPAVLADPVELREALINLVNNATDALPFGGTITLSSAAGRDADGVVLAIITVADTGIGMDDMTLRRIFEPFFTTKTVGQGTGLGLAMVHGIVSRLGGAIDVASQPGNGTMVSLRLPAGINVPHDESEQGSAPKVTSAPPFAAMRRRILLVEDEMVLRATASRILESAGHIVVAAASGEAALAALQGSDAIDIVVTDVGLPGMSGWEFLAELRKHYPDLPVIVASGWVEEGDAKMAAAAELPRDRLLGKPYRAAVLLAAVDRAGRALDAERQPGPTAS